LVGVETALLVRGEVSATSVVDHIDNSAWQFHALTPTMKHRKLFRDVVLRRCGTLGREWEAGVVTQVSLLKVKAGGYDDAFIWDEHRGTLYLSPQEDLCRVRP
jgi:hypothetical protein